MYILQQFTLYSIVCNWTLQYYKPHIHTMVSHNEAQLNLLSKMFLNFKLYNLLEWFYNNVL